MEELLKLAKSIKDKKLRKMVVEFLNDISLSNDDFKKYPKMKLEEASSLFSVGSSMGMSNVERDVLNHTKALADMCSKTVDVLKKRYDLVPNLVETVKGYAAHERSVFENVTKARSMAMGAASPAQKAKAENMFTETLKSLFAVAEAYPELKANQSFLALQGDVSEVENHIQYARRYYNGAVRNLNTRIDSFPDLFIARVFNFRPQPYFALESDGESLPPEVK